MSSSKMLSVPETWPKELLELIKANCHVAHERFDNISWKFIQWKNEARRRWSKLEAKMVQQTAFSSSHVQPDTINRLLEQSQQCIQLLEALPQSIKAELGTQEAVSNSLFEDQIADSTLKEKWRFLQTSIAKICHTLADSEPSTTSWPDHLDWLKKDLGPYVLDHLRDAHNRKFLYQAIVWRNLNHSVLMGGTNVFGDSVRHHYRLLRQSLTNKCSDSETSAMTLQWLVDYPKVMEEYSSVELDLFIDDTVSELCKLANICGQQGRAEAQEGLKDAVKLAIEIDTVCLGLKADIRIEYPHHPTIPGDKRYVQQVPWNLPPDEDGTPILFFIAPLLYKVGDGFGQNRHQCNVLRKATFVCNNCDSEGLDLETAVDLK